MPYDLLAIGALCLMFLANLLRAANGNAETQDFGQSGGSGPMPGRAHRHLHRLQVEPSAPALIAKDPLQQALYFLRDFMMDRICRFFSAAESVPSSAGSDSDMMGLLVLVYCIHQDRGHN